MNMMGDAAICKCNVIEACALHATDCLDGCTGSSARTLVSFLGCFVAGEHPPTITNGTAVEKSAARVDEGTCEPGAKDKCAASAGIDTKKLGACMAAKATQKAVLQDVWHKARKVQTFPHCEVNGRLLAQESEKDAEHTLKAALCKAGASAAC